MLRGSEAWHPFHQRVFICTPLVIKEVDFKWALALRKLILPPYTKITSHTGFTIDLCREFLIENIFDLRPQERPSHIFFLDSDVVVPPDTLIRLLRHQKPFVSGLYFAKKRGELQPAAWRRRPFELGKELLKPEFEKQRLLTEEDFLALREDLKGLQEVDVIGLGCALIEFWIFEKIERPWFAFNLGRYYKGKFIDDFRVSEDFYFCLKVNKTLGIKPIVDFDLRTEHLAKFSLKDTSRPQIETLGDEG